MLKSLEIAGFKSFAKKTELGFKSRITSIVGPNGSGKSNVAESFRFALGEQSIKSMRGKRGEDLIWNGTSDVSRANRASVKIVLDNSTGLFSKSEIIKDGFDEISIERVVGRDGVNEYFLNGSKVRLKDIFELLSLAHIGSSGHHIISQGEADRILSSSGKERKEIIEDALGLKIYQYKREESERKLEKTFENIKQVESLRREIAPHLKFLKKQVEKVEKAEELRQSLAEFYKEYLQRENFYITSEKLRIKQAKNPLLEKMSLLEKQMEEAKRVLENSSKRDEKSEELLNIENKLEESRKERDLLAREIGRIEGEISANNRSIERIEREQRSEENKSILLKEVEELEKKISLFTEITKIFEEIRSFISRHRAEVNTKDLDELRKINSELLTQKNKFESDLKDTDAKIRLLSENYTSIRSSIEKEKDSERDSEKAIFKISSDQSELRSALNILASEESRLSGNEEDFKRELQEAGVLLGTAMLGVSAGAETNFEEEPRKNQEERRRELEKMKIRLEELGAAGGAETMKEYKETLERDEYLERELLDLNKSAESLRTLITELLQKLDTEFNEGIEKINKTFQEYFALMFGGGEAELKIVKSLKLRNKSIDEEGLEILENLDKEDQKEEVGIEINISLPKKRVKSLEMLSGGERALTSIALLFALSSVNPPPFIILDETDAALDESNSKKYGDMIEKLSLVSQLILITHNRETMSRAGIIYGVTMGSDGVSKLLSIAFDEAVAVAK
jgi:chromosome segregation protein